MIFANMKLYSLRTLPITLLLLAMLPVGTVPLRAVIPQDLYQALAEGEARELLTRIAAAQAQTGPQQGEFKQVKTHPFLDERQQSQGSWALLPPRKMRWETLSPQASCAVMDGTQLRLRSGKKTQTLDMEAQPAFASLGLLMRLATGMEPWTPGPDYDFACYAAPGSYKVVIRPQKRELKAFVSTLTLYYTRDLVFHALEMEDPQGGLTHIRLSGIRAVDSLDPALFTL